MKMIQIMTTTLQASSRDSPSTTTITLPRKCEITSTPRCRLTSLICRVSNSLTHNSWTNCFRSTLATKSTYEKLCSNSWMDLATLTKKTSCSNSRSTICPKSTRSATWKLAVLEKWWVFTAQSPERQRWSLNYSMAASSASFVSQLFPQ